MYPIAFDPARVRAVVVGRGRGAARRRQAIMQFAVRRQQVVGEGGVHPGEAVAVVEILESEAESQFKIAHGS